MLFMNYKFVRAFQLSSNGFYPPEIASESYIIHHLTLLLRVVTSEGR